MENSYGLFPASFVTKINIRNLKHGEKLYLAIENFKAQQKGDLEFYKGEIFLQKSATVLEINCIRKRQQKVQKFTLKMLREVKNRS